MNHNDAFSRCHPLVNFLYFALVLLGAMVLQHPVCQAISLIGAIACFLHLGGEKTGRIPAVVRAGAVCRNRRRKPCIQPRGADDSALSAVRETSDARVHSIRSWRGADALHSAGLVLVLHALMTSDKFVYLFGRIVPALSLVLSMTLRFVPRFFRAGKAGFQSAGSSRQRHAYGKSAAPHQMRADGLFDSRDMVSGERSRHGGLHARPGLRTSRQKRIFDLHTHDARQTAARGMGPSGRNRCGAMPQARFPGAIIPAAGAQV